MKKLTILLVFTAFLLSGCGESHTYSGVMKRTGSEGKVSVTIKKQSEKEATMTIARDGNNDPGLFLADCIYPIKLQLDEFQGKNYWSPNFCALKGEFGEKTVSLSANAGEFQVDGKQLKMKVFATNDTDSNKSVFEFTGTEK